MMCNLSLLLALIAFLSLPVSLIAAPVIVDFDNILPGAVVNNQYDGVHFSLLGSPPVIGPRAYILDDKNEEVVNVYGATGNAITPGNVIDEFMGNPLFDFEIMFDMPIDFFSIMVIDAEEPIAAYGYLDGALTQTDLQGVLMGNYEGTTAGGYFRGPVYNLELGVIGGGFLFDRIVIDLIEGDHPAAGPELYDNLVYNPIPEPSPYILVSLGLISIGFTRLYKYA